MKKSLMILFLSIMSVILLVVHYYGVFVISNYKPVLRYKFINCWAKIDLLQLRPLKEVLEKRVTLHHVRKGYDIIISSVFGNKEIDDSSSIKIFYAGEAQKPQIDGYDLSIGFDYIETPNYLRMPYYFMQDFASNISLDYKRGQCNPQEKQIFACFLVSNRKSKPRNDIFHKLSLYKYVASGGKYLTTTGKPIEYKKTEEWLSQCKFVIAYENTEYEGYITEKPFQAYFAGAIPIYSIPSRPEGVLEDFNHKAVINAKDFATDEEFIEYIKKVDNDDKLYCDIWNQKIITHYEQSYEAIKEKLATKLDKILEERIPSRR